MNKFLKDRILPLLLCAAMILGMVPVQVLADETESQAVIAET